MQIRQIYWQRCEDWITLLSREKNGCKDWDYQFLHINGNFQSIVSRYALFNNQGRQIMNPLSGRIYDINVLEYEELMNDLRTIARVSD